MKSETVSYNDLPGQNPLFLSFLYDRRRVEAWYPGSPRCLEDVIARVPQVVAAQGFSRERMVGWLRAYHERLGAGAAVQRNLERLERPGTVAVVAGQQAGLLGGPGFTAYKAATVIRLVQLLREQGVEAVPIFWMAADDSDFEEVRRAHYFASNGERIEVAAPDRRLRPEQMAGTAPLVGMQSLWEELLRCPAESPEARLAGVMGPHYQEGRTFGEAFARWILQGFGEQGLVVFDPLLPEYRTEAAPFFRTAILQREEIVAAVLRRGEVLTAEGFAPQVHVASTETFLFLVEGSARYKLEFVDGRFVPKGKRRMSWTPTELVSATEQGTVQLGPNALLRPVLQDYLLPAVLTVGGAAEVAYFSQVEALSRFWGREPAILPRAGFTVVDQKSRRLLRRYGLDARWVIGHPEEAVTEAIVGTGDNARVLREIDELRAEFEARLGRLRSPLAETDPTVAALLENSSRKVYFQLDKVRRRFLSNCRLRDQARDRHLRYLLTHLMPGGGFQERGVSFASLAAQSGGPGLVAEILQSVEPFDPTHRLLYL